MLWPLASRMPGTLGATAHVLVVQLLPLKLHCLIDVMVMLVMTPMMLVSAHPPCPTLHSKRSHTCVYTFVGFQAVVGNSGFQADPPAHAVMNTV